MKNEIKISKLLNGILVKDSRMGVHLYLLMLEKRLSSAKIKDKSISTYHCIVPFTVYSVFLHVVCLFSFNFLSKRHYITKLMLTDVSRM